ncbi:MAG TPA: peptide ABC transporter substrate-binding protein [Gemmatimonadaceae bacterium]|nr:peptide ABC transporter substrate-binding protein [Gemmatimonadaceae bacterium]
MACSGENKPAPQGENGGTLVIAVGGDPETLFPPLASTTTAQLVGDLVYDRLAEIGDSLVTVGDQGFQPRLAKTWDWAPDSLSIAFHIDPLARWHDGTPVRAGDVASTWRIYSDPTVGSPFATALEDVDSVSATDSLTATVWFKSRSPMQFYDAVNTMLILPEHLLQGAKGPKAAESNLARAPIGTGRYRFSKWNAAQSIELTADTANYRGRPNLDRVILTIASDMNAALVRLKGGDADMLEQIPAPSFAEIAGDTSLRVMLTPGLDYNFVQFNLNDRRNSSRSHPLFGEPGVRRAVTMALDRPSIVRNAYDSLANVAIGPTVRAYPTTDTSLTQIPFNRAEAMRLLDSLGWRDSNGDGIREKDGTPLEFTITVPGPSKARNTMAVLIQEQLRQAGIKVNIEPLDFAAFINKENTRTFDAVFGGWHVEPSPGGIRQTWGSAGAAKGGTNYGSYRNARFDAQVDSALSATSLDARRNHFTSAYQIIIDDAPAVWMAEPKRAMAVQKRIRPVGMRPDAWWANIPDWSIPAAQRIARDRATPVR